MNKLKNNVNFFFFFDSIMMLGFGETKVAKEEFYDAKKPIKILLDI